MNKLVKLALGIIGADLAATSVVAVKNAVEENREIKTKHHKGFYEKYVKNNVPVYLGEFGCANHKPGEGRRYQLYYLEYLSKCAATYGMGGFIWDNGATGTGKEIYGIIDHGTGEYLDAEFGAQIIAVCLKGFTDDSEGYTLRYIHDNAPVPDPKEEE